MSDEDDLARFVVRGPKEIRFLMRQLSERTSLVSAYPADAGHFALLSILDVPESPDEHLILDVSQDEAQNTALLRSERIICVSQLDRVRIQFELPGIQAGRHLDKPALISRMPAAVLRLQRREFYRLQTPVTDPVRCVVPIGEAGKSQPLDTRVLDISGGGVAVCLPDTGHGFHVDREFTGCQLFLQDTQALVIRLRVRNLFKVTLPGGNEILRAGCEFVGLTPAQENHIQRYILRIERERAARGTE
ncbi:flagellar brake protein [Niveibacterium sp. SC-1]|uniref:flagellar brake protein n=1 Tax=Niveibacterium sp. SC-1 TaxID=3135646 RepID=UPI00311DF4D7